MEFSVDNISRMNKATLEQAKTSLLKVAQISKEKKPATAKRATEMANKLEAAKKQLETLITTLSKQEVTYNEAGIERTGNVLQFLGVADESLITLDWIAQNRDLIEGKGVMLDGSVQGLDLSTEAYEIKGDASSRRSIFDFGKDFVSDIGGKNGKLGPRAAATAYGLLGVGAADIAAKAITKGLVTKGLIGESMGIFGVLKFAAFDLLPNTIFPKIVSAATTLYGFSPLGVCALGVFAAFKLVPIIKKIIDKFAEKHKITNYDKELENIIKQNLDPTTPKPNKVPARGTREYDEMVRAQKEFEEATFKTDENADIKLDKETGRTLMRLNSINSIKSQQTTNTKPTNVPQDLADAAGNSPAGKYNAVKKWLEAKEKLEIKKAKLQKATEFKFDKSEITTLQAEFETANQEYLVANEKFEELKIISPNWKSDSQIAAYFDEYEAYISQEAFNQGLATEEKLLNDRKSKIDAITREQATENLNKAEIARREAEAKYRALAGLDPIQYTRT